jgi:hypothetical protein
MNAKERSDLQEKANVLLFRQAVLLQRSAILRDYLRENIKGTRLAQDEQTAVELLIEITERSMDFIKERRRAIVERLSEP